MIEITLLNYLEGVLNVPVLMEQPKDKIDTFVLLEKTGSSKENHICSATFAVQSYAPSMYQAAALNDDVKTAIEAAVLLPEIASVQLNSDYNYTDTATKRYRYQAVFNFTHY